MLWTTKQRSYGDGALTYCCDGVGPSLVLIHGVGLRAEAWSGLMPMLSPHLTVYAVDMPGHGSSPLNGATQLAGYVSRILAFVRSLDGPVCVAGHSMGAMIALEAARQERDKIDGVAGLNAIFRRDPAATAAVRARAAALSRSGITDPRETLARWFGSTPEGSMAEAADACRTWLTSADPEGYAAAYRVFANSDGPLEEQLRAVTCPALFLTGATDPNSTPKMSQDMANLTPAGCAQTIARAAHMMPMTHPDQVAKALLQVFRPPKGVEHE